jgi:hypothetical protein
MLVIIEDGARQEYRVSGSVIHYTRAGWSELRELRNANRDPKTFRVDGDKLDEAILRRHAIGWENVVDRDGKPVAFTADRLLSLPAPVINGLLVEIMSPAQQETAEQGNLPGSSES